MSTTQVGTISGTLKFDLGGTEVASCDLETNPTGIPNPFVIPVVNCTGTGYDAGRVTADEIELRVVPISAVSGKTITANVSVIWPDSGCQCPADSGSTGDCSESCTPVGSGDPCADGDLCNGNEICDGYGRCESGTPPVVDDGNACTTDACDPGLGVTNTPIDPTDGNPCTDDSCDPMTGVSNVNSAIGTPCPDNDVCNGAETCDGAGTCLDAPDLDPDDSNDCTSDTCDAQLGIINTPLPVGTPCPDGDLCNGDETCDAGAVCVGGTPLVADDNNLCTDDDCHPQTGISNVDNFDDNDPCTVDTCDPVTGLPSYTSCSPIDTSVPTSFSDGLGFLWNGDPQDMEPGRLSVLYGTVTDEAGDPLSGVVVDALNASEFGYTTTDAAGRYFFAVNGGGDIVLRYWTANRLASQRQVRSRWESYVPVDEVALIPADPGTPITLQGYSGMAVAQGLSKTDADGTRQATLLFPEDVEVDFTFGGLTETIAPEEEIIVRVTEHTVGDMGEAAMPASMPRHIAYTYAATLSVEYDGDVADYVSFDQPVRMYFENFLGMPVGDVVPLGYYDEASGVWVPQDNGIVLKIIEIDNGEAVVSFDGTTPASSGELTAIGIDQAELEKLAELYSEEDELWRTSMTHFTKWDPNYPWGPDDDVCEPNGCGDGPGGGGGGAGGGGGSGPGGSGSGGEGTGGEGTGGGGSGGGGEGGGSGGGGEGTGGEGTGGGTGNTGNSPGFPADGPAPGGGGGECEPGQVCTEDPGDPCHEASNSIIECGNQILGERIPVAGTPFTLNYRSAGVPGRTTSRHIELPITTGYVPESLKKIEVRIHIAGETHTELFDCETSSACDPHQSYFYQWDGFDVFGRFLQGRQSFRADLSYHYQGVMLGVGAARRAFGAFGLDRVTPIPSRRQFVLTDTMYGEAGTVDPRGVGLGGWTISPHHVFDPSGVIHYGDGGRRVISEVTPVVSNLYPDVTLLLPDAIDFGPDGSLYVGENTNTISRIYPDGTKVIVAGGSGSVDYVSGEGLPANGQAIGVTKLAVADDGTVYFTDHLRNYVLAVTPAGDLQIVAGDGTATDDGDGDFAELAKISQPGAIALSPDGSLLVATLNGAVLSGVGGRIRRISTDGIIETVAGAGSAYTPGDRASNVELALVDGSLAVGPGGEIYLAYRPNGVLDFRILRIGIDGTIDTVLGDGTTSFVDGAGKFIETAEGIPAVDADLTTGVYDLAVAQDGTLYATLSNMVIRIDPAGALWPVVGGSTSCQAGTAGMCGDGDVARRAAFAIAPGIAIDPLNRPVVTDFLNAVHVIDAPAVGDWQYALLGTGSFFIPSEDGSELFVFDGKGRHLQTQDAMTGVVLYSFGYTSYTDQTLLTSITDRDGNITTIERDGTGVPTGILPPFGGSTTETELTVNGDGWLASVENPEAEAYVMGYDGTTGLLTSFTDPRNGLATMQYDGEGRLIKDTNPAGGPIDLVRSILAGGHTVEKITGEGRRSFYDMTVRLDGQRDRWVEAPNGAISTSTEYADGSIGISRADGMSIEQVFSPDPRFGMAARYASQTTETTPGLVTRTTTRFRDVDYVIGGSGEVETLTETTNVGYGNTTRVYNRITRKLTTVTPENRQIVATYDTAGRLVQQDLPGVTSIFYGYDTNGRLNQISQGSRLTTMDFDANGYVDEQTVKVDASTTRTTQFLNDNVGRTTSQINPDSSVIGFGYDDSGNLNSVTPPGKPAHALASTAINLLEDYMPPQVIDPVSGDPISTDTHWDYNLDKQLDRVVLPDGNTIEHGYDTNTGQLLTTSIPSALDIVRTYDGAGRLKTTEGLDGVELEYTYDGQLLTSIEYSGAFAAVVSRGYDDRFMVETEQVGTGPIVSYGYDDDGLLTSAGVAGGSPLVYGRGTTTGRIETATVGNVTETYAYTAYGELDEYISSYDNGTPVEQYSFDLARDDMGRITQKVETILGTTTTYDYEYDAAGRLFSVDDGTTEIQYLYDANGNRDEVIIVGGSTTYATHDNQDRIETQGDFDYFFNDLGQLYQRYDTVTFDELNLAYDVLGNLYSAQHGDPLTAPTIGYLSDAQGRRSQRLTNSTVDYSIIWRNQLQPLATLDGTGALDQTFVYGESPNTPELILQNGSTYRLIKDHLGSTRLVINVDTGAITHNLIHDEWGVETITTGGTLDLLFGFAGGLRDPDTNLVRFGARDYEPHSGRWTAKDPAMFNQDDGPNLFGYAMQNPVSLVDPEGRQSTQPMGPDPSGGVLGAIAGAIASLFGLTVPVEPGLVCQTPEPGDTIREVCPLIAEYQNVCLYHCKKLNQYVQTYRWYDPKQPIPATTHPANDLCPKAITYELQYTL